MRTLGKSLQGSVRLSTQYSSLVLRRDIPVDSSTSATPAASASLSEPAKSS